MHNSKSNMRDNKTIRRKKICGCPCLELLTIAKQEQQSKITSYSYIPTTHYTHWLAGAWHCLFSSVFLEEMNERVIEKHSNKRNWINHVNTYVFNSTRLKLPILDLISFAASSPDQGTTSSVYRIPISSSFRCSRCRR